MDLKDAKKKAREMFKSKAKGDKDYSDKMEGMKKVTVASDSAEGLQKGLSMAEKLLAKRKEMKDGGSKESYSDGGSDNKSQSMMDAYKKSKKKK